MKKYKKSKKICLIINIIQGIVTIINITLDIYKKII